MLTNEVNKIRVWLGQASVLGKNGRPDDRQKPRVSLSTPTGNRAGVPDYDQCMLLKLLKSKKMRVDGFV